MKNIPKLIVMLTHHDKTVANAIEVFESAKSACAEYWGFKEIGIPEWEMKILVQNMKAAGKTTFLEVVAYTEKECLEGAELGARCGFDYLMGTFYFDSVKAYMDTVNMTYMPFVGRIAGRPSILEGTIEEIIKEANDLVETKGIAGFDLLGYRFTGDAVKLNREFVNNVRVPTCIAGSIANFQRLDEVKSTGAWAFTIGGAFFENKFGSTSFAEQVNTVVAYMNK